MAPSERKYYGKEPCASADFGGERLGERAHFQPGWQIAPAGAIIVRLPAVKRQQANEPPL
jgi:hypothetical protein